MLQKNVLMTRKLPINDSEPLTHVNIVGNTFRYSRADWQLGRANGDPTVELRQLSSQQLSFT